MSDEERIAIRNETEFRLRKFEMKLRKYLEAGFNSDLDSNFVTLNSVLSLMTMQTGPKTRPAEIVSY